MQGGRIALGRHTRPFAEGIKCYIDIVRTVATFVAGGGPDKVLTRVQTQSMLRVFDIYAIEVSVIGLPDLSPVKFRSTDEKMNEVLRAVKARASYKHQQ